MGVAVDASVVIAWQNPDHVFHSEATALIAEADPPLFMGDLNLAEVLVGLDRSSWASLTKAMVSLGFHFVTPSAFDIAGARIDTNLRMPDAYMIATAQKLKATKVLSFDTSIIAAAKSLGFTTN